MLLSNSVNLLNTSFLGVYTNSVFNKKKRKENIYKYFCIVIVKGY